MIGRFSLGHTFPLVRLVPQNYSDLYRRGSKLEVKEEIRFLFLFRAHLVYECKVDVLPVHCQGRPLLRLEERQVPPDHLQALLVHHPGLLQREQISRRQALRHELDGLLGAGGEVLEAEVSVKVGGDEEVGEEPVPDGVDKVWVDDLREVGEGGDPAGEVVRVPCRAEEGRAGVGSSSGKRTERWPMPAASLLWLEEDTVGWSGKEPEKKDNGGPTVLSKN